MSGNKFRKFLITGMEPAYGDSIHKMFSEIDFPLPYKNFSHNLTLNLKDDTKEFPDITEEQIKDFVEKVKETYEENSCIKIKIVEIIDY